MTTSVVTRAGIGRAAGSADVDPIRTEVIRYGLVSAANQMKRALIRTAFSPIIYDVLDFAVAIYDQNVRLLAQAPSLPLFMGRLSFCIESAVAEIGGAPSLEVGDVLLTNHPFTTGSHPQDAAIIMPIFHRDERLIGYAAVMAHWLDVGGKDPYATDTVDMYQEGTIFPGVKLMSQGKIVQDIYRLCLANSRAPRAVAGDINAEVVAVRTGAEATVRVVDKYGREAFEESVERMFDHGEALVRKWFEKIPDGRYIGEGILDNDGVTTDQIVFPVEVTVSGSSVTVDYSRAPDQRAGPVNSPLPKTVAGSRVAISMLAAAGDAPNEGHFRPIEVVTRPGSLFHPLPPAPTFVGGWATVGGIDAIYSAFGKALPTSVPASSGGDICALLWWGRRSASGEPWVDGSPRPVGQGASARGDGAHTLMHISQSGTRSTPTEVSETRYPWLIEKAELAADSGGAGRFRGGNGLDLDIRLLEKVSLTSVVDRTTRRPPGLEGGGSARPNAAFLVRPDGTRIPCSKGTRIDVPAESVLELRTGGGGAFGDPHERAPRDVHADIREGYVTAGHARIHYPHAFPTESSGTGATGLEPADAKTAGVSEIIARAAAASQGSEHNS